MRLRNIQIFLALACVVFGVAAPRAATAFSVFAKAANGGANGNCFSVAGACDINSAIQAAGPDGEVTCISPGFYTGALTITAGITFDCPGAVFESFIINAPGKTVRLNGIYFNNSGCNCGVPMIAITGASNVELEGVVVTQSQSTQPALFDNRPGPGKLFLRNTVISHNMGAGLVIVPQSGTITVALDNVASWNNTYGLAVGAGGRVMIDRSTFAGNTTAGIEADGGTFIGVNNTMISSNSIGVQAGGTISLSNSDIKSNNMGISGATQSFGNNRFFANISDGMPPSIVAQH